MKEMKKMIKKAFTLTEMLIVVIIIGILAGIMVPMISENIQKTRDVSRESQLASIKQALEVYYTNKTSFPTPDKATDDNNGPVTIKDNDTNTTQEAIIQGIIDEKVAKEIGLDRAPVDPARQIKYIYSITTDGKKYGILGFKENGQPMYRGNAPVVIIEADSNSNNNMEKPLVVYTKEDGTKYEMRNAKTIDVDSNNQLNKNAWVIEAFENLSDLQGPTQPGDIDFFSDDS